MLVAISNGVQRRFGMIFFRHHSSKFTRDLHTTRSLSDRPACFEAENKKKQRRTRENTTVDRSVCKCEREYLYTTLDFCGRGRVVALVLFRSTRTNETFCSRGRIFAEWKRCPFIPFFLFQAGRKVPDEKKRKFGRRCLIVIIKFQHNGEREGVVMKFPPTLFSHQQNKYFPSY